MQWYGCPIFLPGEVIKKKTEVHQNMETWGNVLECGF